MAILQGRNCRVFLNGVDISHMVRGLSVEARVDSVVMTTVEFLCGVSFEDGAFRLEGPVQVGPVASPDTAPLKIRAMQLTGDIGT